MANQLDWYNTLLATAHGRRVLYEIRQMGLTWFRADDKDMTADEAAGQCVLDDFIMRLSEKCGIKTPEAEMRMIEYEAEIVASLLETGDDEPESTNL